MATLHRAVRAAMAVALELGRAFIVARALHRTMATRPIGEFDIDLPRPRDVAEVRTQPRFVELHKQIWDVLRDEVLKGYAQQLKKAA